jgi:hypothetical protein
MAFLFDKDYERDRVAMTELDKDVLDALDREVYGVFDIEQLQIERARAALNFELPNKATLKRKRQELAPWIKRRRAYLKERGLRLDC